VEQLQPANLIIQWISDESVRNINQAMFLMYKQKYIKLSLSSVFEFLLWQLCHGGFCASHHNPPSAIENAATDVS
jgi:hypothetical protein